MTGSSINKAKLLPGISLNILETQRILFSSITFWVILYLIQGIIEDADNSNLELKNVIELEYAKNGIIGNLLLILRQMWFRLYYQKSQLYKANQ